MVQRDSSYTLCKGFIRELFTKYSNIEKVSFEVLDILDNSINTKIDINGKIKNINIVLNKKKKKESIKSLDNLKKIYSQQKIENDEKEESLKSLNNENKRNAIIIVSDNKNEDNIYTNVDNTYNRDYLNKSIDETNILNVENKIDEIKDEIFVDDNRKINHNINSTELEENKLLKDEIEVEDIYDYEDPYFSIYPNEFRCYNCYETNIEKDKMFNYTKEIINKCTNMENEIKKLKDDKIDKEKIIKLYNNENKELKNIINKEEDKYISYITNLNDNFMDLFLITHNSLDSIKTILLTLEKTNPKKVHDIINKNINKYRKELQNIADEADIVRNKHLISSNNTFSDKIKV